MHLLLVKMYIFRLFVVHKSPVLVVVVFKHRVHHDIVQSWLNFGGWGPSLKTEGPHPQGGHPQFSNVKTEGKRHYTK